MEGETVSQLESTGTFGILLASERAGHQPHRQGKAPTGKQSISGLEARGNGQVEPTECFCNIPEKWLGKSLHKCSKIKIGPSNVSHERYQ